MFLLIAFCGGNSWLTAVGLIGKVPVAIFKVFHLMMFAAELFSFIRNSITA
jgi:hypothetical protein